VAPSPVHSKHCLTHWDNIFFFCSLLKPKFVFFPVKNFSKMEACYNKWCSYPIYKSYWYVSYSSFLFLQWVPLNRHLCHADAWNRFPLNLLFCTHRKHALLTMFQLSGPLVHLGFFFRISHYEVIGVVSTPPWMRCYFVVGLSPQHKLHWYPSMHAGGERRWESKMSCVRAQLNARNPT